MVTLRWLGLLVGLALVSESMVAMLQANQHFLALTWTIGVSSIAYCVAVVFGLHPGDPLVTLIWLTAFRYVVITVCGFCAIYRHLRLRRPLLRARRTKGIRPVRHTYADVLFDIFL